MLDGLVWGAGQFGGWGRQSHQAFAFTAEAGYQPKHVWGRPWLRTGFSHFSGDDNPADARHDTFFPILPTPRIYARFPFYTEMNLNDAFAQVMLRPHPRLNVRADLHLLSLANRHDLWYTGGGAFQDQPLFGYAGRPSNGRQRLGTRYEASAEYQLRKSTALSAYFGYADGGSVIGQIYGKSRGGFLGYLEITHRW
jgi:hypothetical protein